MVLRVFGGVREWTAFCGNGSCSMRKWGDFPFWSIFSKLFVAYRSSLMAVTLLIVGCGRVGAPLAPERLAPAAVREFKVKTSDDAVVLSWTAPDKDLRGLEIKFLDGYKVFRLTRDGVTQVLAKGDMSDYEYELVAEVKDTHVMERDSLRAAARAEGKVGRGLQVPAEQLQFEYSDKDVAPGLVYFYSVVPYNNGDVEGTEKSVARVIFKGEDSSVLIVNAGDIAFPRK